MRHNRGVMVDAARPVLVHDDAEGVWRRVVARVRAHTDERIEILSIAQAEARFPEPSPDDLRQTLHLVMPDDEIVRGPRAIFEALAQGGGSRRWARLYDRFPGFAVLIDALFALVARHPRAASRLARRLEGPDEGPPTHHLARWATLRVLGVASLAAFLSIRGQLAGLFGEAGLAPMVPRVQQVRAYGESQGWSALGTFRHFPTLLLFHPTDGFARALCTIGVIASVSLVLDVLPWLATLVIWACYLSLVTAGSDFFHFQWDQLLLETCVVALFLAPLRRFRPALRDREPPSALGLWMMRLLVFKLMLLSGAVKLLSKDETWSSLTALDYHYWTQPLPSWTSWYAHHLPRWVGKASVALTFVIELVLPFFVVAPRRLRRLAFWGFVLLQVVIASTGSYGFFNLLTVVTSLVLLDDGAWPRWMRARLVSTKPRRLLPVAVRWARNVAAALVLLVSATHFVAAFMKAPQDDLPETLRDLDELVEPFDSVGAYGLFRTMTTRRPEIIVEGSNDGVEWRAYEFPYKPGDPGARPRSTFLHMPRLDWELWFAALRGHCTRAPVYVELVRRLLQGSAPVRGLLANDPFPEAPPTFVRSTLWAYEFTAVAEQAATGAYWKCQRLGLYCPTLALQDGELVPVEP